MRTNDIGKVEEQMEVKRMRYRCTIFGCCVPCGAYVGKSTIKRRLIGEWLVLHKARLTFTIPLHHLQSVADKERNGVPICYLKGLSDLPISYFMEFGEKNGCYKKLQQIYKIKDT